MEVELSQGTCTNVAKRFSRCWTYQQKIQFNPSGISKSSKLTQLNEGESMDDRSNQQPYEIPSRTEAVSPVEVIESKLEEKLRQYQNKLKKLKPRITIVHEALSFIVSEAELQRPAAEVKP